MRKLGSYWGARCATRHSLTPLTGHTMRTKSAAIQEWNREHGPKP